MFKLKSSQPSSRSLRGNSESHLYQMGPIELRSIATLVDYDKSPRKHPDRQIAKLMQSIREFGFTMPVLVDSRSVIIAGQARVEAARRLQLTELPVLIADLWSEKQVRAYRLADNRLAELGSWDRDALSVEISAIIEIDHTPVELLGWEAGEVMPVQQCGRSGSRAKRVEQCQSPSANRVAIEGDLWRLDRHLLLCGASSETSNWDQLLGGTSASLAFTSLPLTGLSDEVDMQALGSTADGLPRGLPSSLSSSPTVAAVIELLPRQLKPGGFLMVAADWRNGPELALTIEATSLSIVHMCVRTKPAGEQGELYRSGHDLIWIARKLKGLGCSPSLLGSKRLSRTDVWAYPPDGSDDFRCSRGSMGKPELMPVSLIEDVIRDVTRTGEIVIDPFVGWGNTILAAERTRRRVIGVESDPLLVDVAIRRWEALTGKPAVHAHSGETFAVIESQRKDRAREIAL